MIPLRKSHRPAVRTALAALAAAGMLCAGLLWFRSSHIELAREDAARGDRHAAVRHYLDHLDEFSDDYSARLELAEFLKPINAAQALRHLKQIPESAPEYSEAVRHMAHIAVVSQQDALAEQSLLELDRVRPNDAGVALSLAELYFRTGQYGESLSWVEQAAALQPGRAHTWLLYAEVLDQLRRPGEMRQPLKKAIELDTELYAAHANLAYALHFSGQLDEAEAEARWCLERKPDDSRVRRWLAMTLRDRGEHAEALKQIRVAIAEAPTDVDCRIVEADLLLFRREAEQAYRALIPLYPANAQRRDYLGSLSRAAALSGRREEARRYQQEVMAIIDGRSE